MEIEKIALNKIQPNTFNPNKMPDGTFQKLKLSITKFGIFNPILVRKKENKYEIIDGEWRWRAFQDLRMYEIPCRVIEATDEEVKQMIFASTIKGKHNAYDSQQILRDFLETSDSDTLKACNKGEAIQKGQKSKKKHVDESYGLPELGEYIAVLAIPLPNKIYQEITDKLSKLDKDLGKAFLKLINFKETEPKG